MLEWSRVQSLNGKTLQTQARGKAFRIVDVTPDRIEFVPEAGSGARRWEGRLRLEHLAGLNLPAGHLTPQRIQEEFPDSFNSSYLAAIMAAL